jgi:hypothetical protein
VSRDRRLGAIRGQCDDVADQRGDAALCACALANALSQVKDILNKGVGIANADASLVRM